jgi:glycolate oxidase iron-sulfur subunit
VDRNDLIAQITSAADQCVRCGLCLPHCPTYRLRADEGESPRGRIALIQGWAEGSLEDSRRLRAHLASCLECRACETACPSLVAFGRLMDDARTLRRASAGPWRRRLQRLWLDALASPLGVRAASLCARAYRGSGAARLLARSRLVRSARLRAWHRVAVQLQAPARTGRRPQSPDRPEIDLFIGCVGRAAEPSAIAAAREVLERLGWAVHTPPGQRCCGAMHRHNGFPDEADRLLAGNASALGARPVVGLSSACVAELRTHPGLAGCQEVCRFLADQPWPAETKPRALRQRVAVHEPCSQRNLLRDPDAAYDLLRRIPGVEPVALADNAFCCGAAGTYLLSQPEVSQSLLAPKLQALARLGVEILVTTNTGCALHLAAGVREAGIAAEVLHPVELLARQLRPARALRSP